MMLNLRHVASAGGRSHSREVSAFSKMSALAQDADTKKV